MDINGKISPIIHCNQLKPVGAPIIHQPIPAQRPPKDCTPQCHLKSKPSVFDELIYDEEEGQDTAPPQHPIIDHGWCNLSQNSIIYFKRETGNGVTRCYHVTYINCHNYVFAPFCGFSPGHCMCKFSCCLVMDMIAFVIYRVIFHL